MQSYTHQTYIHTYINETRETQTLLVRNLFIEFPSIPRFTLSARNAEQAAVPTLYADTIWHNLSGS